MSKPAQVRIVKLVERDTDEEGMSGVMARANISIPYGDGSIHAHVDSPGVWGVDDESADGDYGDEIYSEERDTLLAMLESLKTATIE